MRKTENANRLDIQIPFFHHFVGIMEYVGLPSGSGNAANVAFRSLYINDRVAENHRM
ncbi:MAG: hypothetical protein P8184_03725 [Calditrichia bacterium]